MNSITFFLSFIPILTLILLGVNLIFAPHNPYQEKSSTFECGFHSFLGQNRTQFNISFFIFGLLFLVFDLELVMALPGLINIYNLQEFGISIMIIFFGILTVGFAFEIGKNALNIDSRQYNFLLFSNVGWGIISELKDILKRYVKHFSFTKLIIGAIKTRLIVSIIPIIFYLLNFISLSTVFVISSFLIYILIIYTLLKTQSNNKFKTVIVLTLNIIVLTVLFSIIPLIITYYFYPMALGHLLLLKTFFSMDNDLLFDYSVEQEQKSMSYVNKSKKVQGVNYMEGDSSGGPNSNDNNDANSSYSSNSSDNSDIDIDNDIIELIAERKHGISNYELTNKLTEAKINKCKEDNKPDAEEELCGHQKYIEKINSDVAEFKEEIAGYEKELEERGMSRSEIDKKVEKAREEFIDNKESEERLIGESIKALEDDKNKK